MWKCIQRGLKESLERGLNLGRNDVRVNRERNKSTYCGSAYIKTPSIVECQWRRRHNCNNGFDESKGGTNEKKYQESYWTQDPFDKLLGVFSYVSNLKVCSKKNK